MTVTDAAGAERRRLHEADTGVTDWRRWGPYLSERQWGTVREDYSASRRAWDYLPHDHARSRAYRWGEDGIAGVCDDEQLLCLALALWNGRDPILKERLFGLDQRRGQPRRGRQGVLLLPRQHADPLVHAHALQVPAAGVPLHRPGRHQPRARPRRLRVRAARHRRLRRRPLLRRATSSTPRPAPEDILVRVTVHNRGPEDADLHLLPTLWFRNTWSWAAGRPAAGAARLRAGPAAGQSVVEAEHDRLGRRRLVCVGAHPVLFTENETNAERLFGGDERRPRTSRTASAGTSWTARRARSIPRASAPRRPSTSSSTVPGGRLGHGPAAPDRPAGRRRRRTPTSPTAFDAIVDAGAAAEAGRVLRRPAGRRNSATDERQVVRQALAGHAVEQAVLRLRRGAAGSPSTGSTRWTATGCATTTGSTCAPHDIISMPDTWEYPWFAAWDLAFHGGRARRGRRRVRQAASSTCC